jgi:hypothetical protein
MKTITTSDLVNLLLSETGKSAKPIGFSAITKVNAVKKDRVTKIPNPYDEIFKLSKVSAFINYSYEASTNYQRLREKRPANFIAEDRKWGEAVNNALVRLGEKYYLNVKIEKTRKPIYLIKKNGSFHVIKKELVAPFLPLPSLPSRQELQNEVIVRNYGIETITRFNINKEQFRIKDDSDNNESSKDAATRDEFVQSQTKKLINILTQPSDIIN